MSVNPTESTPSRSQSAPVEGIKARRNQRVLLAVAKAFGVSRTLRDPETGVYHVVSGVVHSLDLITSSPIAGTAQEKEWAKHEHFIIDDLVGYSIRDAQFTNEIMRQIMRDLGL